MSSELLQVWNTTYKHRQHKFSICVVLSLSDLLNKLCSYQRRHPRAHLSSHQGSWKIVFWFQEDKNSVCSPASYGAFFLYLLDADCNQYVQLNLPKPAMLGVLKLPLIYRTKEKSFQNHKSHPVTVVIMPFLKYK